MTEEKTKTEEVINTNTTEKGKLFKDIQEADDWKNAHLADKKETELHRDEWKRKFYESDKKNIALAKKNIKLMEEIEAMEKDDLYRRKVMGQDEIDEKQKKEKQKQLSNFLNRIK